MSQDQDAIEALAATSDITRPHSILHYLYLARQEDAVPVTRLLEQQGFHVEDRLGGDGVNWLVLATHQTIPSKESIAADRQVMESLARRYAGEYDGWEAQVAPTP